jgi:hypothetical protein
MFFSLLWGTNFRQLVVRRDYYCGGENCFPAAWHNLLCDIIYAEAPFSVFFAGGQVVAKICALPIIRGSVIIASLQVSE